MNRLTRFFLSAVVLLGLVGLTGCDNPGVNPKSSTTANNIFQEDGSYRSFLAKIYGSLNVTGQQGPSGDGDIQGIDEGFSQYMRLYWKLQQLPSDEAVIAWSDNGIRTLSDHDWSSGNQFTTAMYDRIYFSVAQANEFLRESTPERLDAYGVDSNRRERIPQYRAEARFVRALVYYHAVDLFGNVPLVTEETTRGSEAPTQNTRAEIFEYAVSELEAITAADGDETLPDAGMAEYGRADKAAAQMVLAKLYLNAEVYVGENRYNDAVRVLEDVLDGSYRLEPDYHHLFLADNHTADGLIFTIPQDGERTQHFGGTTFLNHAPVGGNMDPAAYGLDFGWAGLRTTAAAVDRYDQAQDSRAIFYTDGQSKEINDIGTFTDGFAVPKYQNVTSTGEDGSNQTFPDTDYPMFRIADAYLMYAEAVVRGGGGDPNRALRLVNDLRERAFGNTNNNITSSELTLEFILDERSRELLWEGHRRSDLVRFNEFTENGIWPWKGGVKEGTTTPGFRNLFPIPASELRANPNLEQNPGYDEDSGDSDA